MIVNINHIHDNGLQLDFVESFKRFPLLSEMEASGEFRFLSPVTISGFVEMIREYVYIKGSLFVEVSVGCARCLEPFDHRVKKRFNLTFLRYRPDETVSYDDYRVRVEELGIFLFRGDLINLRDALQEQLVMALPGRLFCDEDCRGICPGCGKNLNLEACACTDSAETSPFAVLLRRPS